jgi:coenzyme F420-reducing hydrogenase beta subunit
MKPAIEVIGKDKCTGCFGCYNSCPRNAIQMKIEKGFFVPTIDKKKCNNCGLCNKFCPVINNVKDKFTSPRAFAAKTKDKKLLLESSSGGIFGELANYFFEKEGVVYGAGFDKDFNLVHMEIKDKLNLSKILGSKYLQSNIGFSYKKIINQLKKGGKILFCGTPCQISSLNLFIKKINPILQENILTCDLVCHGVPSLDLFKKYINKLEVKNKSKVKKISFRSKREGWRNFSMEIDFGNKKYIKNHRIDSFMQEFLNNKNLRISCYDCQFSKIPRCGDITLGDLWGAKSGFYNSKGVSFISINSKKGEEAIKMLEKEKRIILKRYPLAKAIKDNPRIDYYKINMNKKTKEFFLLTYLWYYLSKLKTYYQNVFYKKF